MQRLAAPATRTEAAKAGGWRSLLLGPYARHPRDWSDWQIFFLAMSLITLAYLGLYHPHWVPGGDAELYLAMARNLALGEGYRYNGQPVALVPPGWPMLLAGGMWLTSVVALLKFMLIGSMLIYLGSAFWVMRAYVPAWWCAATILIVGMLQPTWQLSMWFFSDGPFLAASWLALLMAVQARQRHATAGVSLGVVVRVALALALLALATSIRWNGLLWAPIIALALLDGRSLARLVSGPRLEVRLWPKRLDGLWIAAILVPLIAAVTFFGLRAWLKVDPSQLDPRYSTFESGVYELVNSHGNPTVATHIQRFFNGPQWISVVYWNMAGRTQPLRIPVFYLAGLTVIPLVVAGLVGLVRRQWLWLGAAVAWVPVLLIWPNAIDRYTMPVAPFLVLGTILGTAWLCRWLDRPMDARWRLLALAVGLAGFIWLLTWLLASLAWPTLHDFAPNVLDRQLAAWTAGVPDRVLATFGNRALVMGAAIALLAVILLLILRRLMQAAQASGAGSDRRLPWLLRRTPVLVVAPAAVLLVTYNLGVYAMEFWVARDPVARYDAGTQASLSRISHFLRINDESVYPGEVAVSPVRHLNRVRFDTQGQRRKVVWLTARNAVDVPFHLAHEPGDEPGRWRLQPPLAPQMEEGQVFSPQLIDWLREHNARWYVLLPRQERFLHFFRPPWKAPADEPVETDWQLYSITGEGIERMDVSDQPAEVLVVPGLEDVRNVAGGRARLPIPYN